MRIGVDFDDVLADFLPYHNEKYGTSFNFGGFFSFKYWEVIGGSREDAVRKVRDFVLNNNDSIEPLELRELRE